MNPLVEACRQHHLFEGFSEKDLAAFLETAAIQRSLGAHETLIEEGETGDSLYIVVDGRLEILKRDSETGREHRINSLGAGQSLGTVALFDPTSIRSASVRTLAETKVLEVPFSRLDELYPRDLSPGGRFRENVAIELAESLRGISDRGVGWLQSRLEEAEKRAVLGRFVVKILVAASLYMFVLGVAQSLVQVLPSPAIVGVPILLMFALNVVLILRDSPFPMKTHGLTLDGWRSATLDALKWTVPLLALIVLTKYVFLRLNPPEEDVLLFSLGRDIDFPAWVIAINFIVYSILAPIQEIIVRSGIQVPLEMFLVGKGRTWMSMLVASLLFSATHLHLSVSLALAVFPLGLFWGWLFFRHRTLVGVAVSHIVVGVFGFLIVGLDFLIR